MLASCTGYKAIVFEQISTQDHSSNISDDQDLSKTVLESKIKHEGTRMTLHLSSHCGFKGGKMVSNIEEPIC